jgi:predicted ester cyclase
VSVEENKRVLQRYFDELMNRGDYSKVGEILHEDYFGSAAGGLKGIEGHRRYRAYMHAAAPDGRFETLEMIAEGDKVAIFQEWKGTFVGVFNGVQGRGQPVSRTISSIYEFRDGKVVRGLVRQVTDLLSFFQQLIFFRSFSKSELCLRLKRLSKLTTSPQNGRTTPGNCRHRTAR